MHRCLVRRDADLTYRQSLEAVGRWWRELSERKREVATTIHRGEQRNFLKCVRFYRDTLHEEIPYHCVMNWYFFRKNSYKLDLQRWKQEYMRQ